MEPRHLHIGYLIKVISNQFRKLADAELEKYDLTASQFDVLMYLERQNREGHEVMQKDIEKYFRISNPSVSGLISRLEQKGFVKRVRSEKDRRICHIVTTKYERQICHDLWLTRQKREEGIRQCLGSEDYDRLLNDLITLSGHLAESINKEESHA